MENDNTTYLIGLFSECAKYLNIVKFQRVIVLSFNQPTFTELVVCLSVGRSGR